MPTLGFATRLAEHSDMTLRAGLVCSFLFAAFVRLVPELVAWPRVIGYDLVAYYAPVLAHLDLTVNGLRLLLLTPNYSPLLYLLVMPFARVFGEFAALRSFAVLTYGLLGAAVFIFAEKHLEWSPRASLFASILASIYFVTLRIGLDLLKNLLGLVLLLSILALMRRGYESPRSRSLIVVLGVLLAATHQLSVLVLLFVAVGLAASKLLSGRRSDAVRIVASILPAAVVLLVLTLLGSGSESAFLSARGVTVYYLPLNTQGTPTSPFVNYLAQYGSYSGLLADVEHLFLFLYLPILPLVILGINRDRVLALLAFGLLLGSFFLLASPTMAPLGYTRWMLMLTIPFSLYAAKGAIRLIRHIKVSTRRLGGAFVILLLLGSLGFSFAVFQTDPLGYFTPPALLPYFPSSMQTSSIPLSDEQDVTAILGQLNTMMGSDSVLLVHESFYGWASLTIIGNTTIIDYHLGKPTDALPLAKQLGFARIYWIWWLPGYEWHNYRAPLNLFKPILQSGHLAVFLYEPS